MHDRFTAGKAPPAIGPAQKLVQLAAGEQISGFTISEAIWGVGTHWRRSAGPKGRSERCTEDEGHCQGCEDQLPYRWKGYVEIWCRERARPVFVELTLGAYNSLMSALKHRQKMRGLLFHAKRKGKKATTALIAWLEESYHDLAFLPAPTDPEETLELLWNWDR